MLHGRRSLCGQLQQVNLALMLLQLATEVGPFSRALSSVAFSLMLMTLAFDLPVASLLPVLLKA